MLVTLDNVALGAFETFGWPSESAGLVPIERRLVVERQAGEFLFGQGLKPMDLVFGDVTIKNIFIKNTADGDNPHTIGLVITDIRWVLARILVSRAFNVPRRTGEVTYANPNIQIQNRALRDDVKYASYSLQNSQKAWDLEAALGDVITEVAAEIDRRAGVSVQFSVPSFDREVLLEGFELTAYANELIMGLLGFAPGYLPKLKADGNFDIYDSIDGSEEAVLKDHKPVIQGSGWAEKADRKFLRPSKINFYFVRECELRFDYFEEDTQQSVVAGREPRRLENVLPNPDPTLTVNGVQLAQGAYVSFLDLYQALAPLQPVPAIQAFGVISHRVMRFLYMKPWACQGVFYLPPPLTDLSWKNRMNKMFSHWRRTFRITKPWMDRIKDFRLNRVAIVDPANRTRANSPVYTDWTEKPAMLGIARSAGIIGGVVPDTVFSHEGYSPNLQFGDTAPVDLSIRDRETGVFRVFLLKDPYGNNESLIPGLLVDNPKTTDISLAFAFVNDATVVLQDGWRMAIILTAIQAGPNSLGRFHKETVTPADAQKKLGSIVKIGECFGPEFDVFVTPTETKTARFMWRDDDKDIIEEAFFTGKKEIPKRLLSNKAEVEEIAHANAAAIYASMRDSFVGSYSTANDAVEIAGAIAQVVQTADASGQGFTTVVLPQKGSAINPRSFIDAAIQKQLFSRVQP